MKRDFGYLPNLSQDDILFIKNIKEWVDNAQTRYKRKFTHFLTEKQCDIVTSVMKSIGSGAYTLYGGWDAAKRRVLAVYNEYDEALLSDFPITAFTVRYQNAYTLSHRDFLGALMSLGIKRDCIGDIVIDNGAAVLFVHSSVSPVVENEITKIGRVGVSVSEGSDALSSMNTEDRFRDITGTVASLRLDCVLSLALGLSRSRVAPLILAKKVIVNNFERLSGDFVLSENDTFSVKGFGKFILSEIGGQSRKDRTFIRVSKYL